MPITSIRFNKKSDPWLSAKLCPRIFFETFHRNNSGRCKLIANFADGIHIFDLTVNPYRLWEKY